MVTLHYSTTKEDYELYYTFMYWDKKDRKRKRLRNLLKQAIFYLLIISFLFFSKSYSFLGSYSIGIFLFVLVFNLLPFFTGRAQIVKQAESITNDPENESIFMEVTVVATDTDLHLKDKFTQTTTLWAAIIKKIETPTHYYLFINGMQAYLIPKRAFKNNEEKSAFDKILSRNLSLDAELNDFNNS